MYPGCVLMLVLEEDNMKKRIFVAMLCCILLLFSGCNGKSVKYKRISFESETLGEELERISEDTVVTYNAKETFQNEMPIYKISKHAISKQEIEQMEDNLGVAKWHWNDFDGYEVLYRVAPYSDPGRGYFYTLNMTDEELEDLAWKTLNKIPFIDGEYEYAGITGEMSVWTMESGEYLATEVTVSFYRRIDGVSVVGNERCNLTFDASGLVEIYVAMYDYEEIGTMDMVTLEEAQERIKSPDYFSIDQGTSSMKELEVERTRLYLVNQYSRGCTILQPIYTFYGTASFEDGAQKEFKSRIIAIPESMTYVEE